MCGSQGQPQRSVVLCPEQQQLHQLIVKPVPWRGALSCGLKLAISPISLGSRNKTGKDMVRIWELFRRIENRYCCLCTVRSIEVIFFNCRKLGWRKGSFSYLLICLSYLLEKKGTHGLSLHFDFVSWEGLFFLFEYTISHQSKKLQSNLSYWNHVSYHNFI